MEQSQERIDFKYIFDGILKVLNFEKGLFLTTREMLFRPGAMIRDLVKNNLPSMIKINEDIPLG